MRRSRGETMARAGSLLWRSPELSFPGPEIPRVGSIPGAKERQCQWGEKRLCRAARRGPHLPSETETAARIKVTSARAFTSMLGRRRAAGAEAGAGAWGSCGRAVQGLLLPPPSIAGPGPAAGRGGAGGVAGGELLASAGCYIPPLLVVLDINQTAGLLLRSRRGPRLWARRLSGAQGRATGWRPSRPRG